MSGLGFKAFIGRDLTMRNPVQKEIWGEDPLGLIPLGRESYSCSEESALKFRPSGFLSGS